MGNGNGVNREYFSISKSAITILLTILGAIGASFFVALLDAHLKINLNSEIRTLIIQKDIIAQVIANTDLRRRISDKGLVNQINSNTLFRQSALQDGVVFQYERDDLVNQLAEVRARIVSLEKADARIQGLLDSITKTRVLDALDQRKNK